MTTRVTSFSINSRVTCSCARSKTASGSTYRFVPEKSCCCPRTFHIHPSGSLTPWVSSSSASGVTTKPMASCGTASSCDARLYGEYLHVTNIETDLPPVFDRFWSNPEHTRCRNCGAVMRK